jgi:hypothetical protein
MFNVDWCKKLYTLVPFVSTYKWHTIAALSTHYLCIGRSVLRISWCQIWGYINFVLKFFNVHIIVTTQTSGCPCPSDTCEVPKNIFKKILIFLKCSIMKKKLKKIGPPPPLPRPYPPPPPPPPLPHPSPPPLWPVPPQKMLAELSCGTHTHTVVIIYRIIGHKHYYYTSDYL